MEDYIEILKSNGIIKSNYPEDEFDDIVEAIKQIEKLCIFKTLDYVRSEMINFERWDISNQEVYNNITQNND